MSRSLIAAVMLSLAVAAEAASFRFESTADPANGLTAATKSDGGLAMSFQAAPAGAVFDVRTSGLGLNSRAIAGVSDGEIDKFNRLGGSLAGQSETLTFSFDKPGFITSLDFDGVKDESFEYFRLETPGGEVLSIFDSQIGLRLVDLSLITEPNVTLLTEEGSPDDDLFDIAIPFGAGEVFTLTYREYTPDPTNYQPGFSPLVPNGARFQGLTAILAPEPASALSCLFAGVAIGSIKSRGRR
ncbi:hypothetical protein Pla108_33970 [Botrimarina colliarenosi]|uniref:PEP-CTERM protein-sorting domain-containing protein n=1 Tax=Botrimarina colliarenosi TaxID=2528001 RepID=A0A5C6AAA0_9BACT|nr:hypothetical protein [Botrimarina colliarenosi]TWT95253.1 hypothetical protein Pla108_33970 [Botrimarina colliarenosi]